MKLLLAALLVCFAVQANGQGKEPPAKKPKPPPAALDVSPVAWRGDFDQMLERRVIRVVVPYSRSLFFLDKGGQRGLTADLLEDFERWLNKKHGTGNRVLALQIFPVARDQLLPRLVKGEADIAAGNLTITAQRDKVVDFSIPTAEGIDEILMTARGVAAPADLDGLAAIEIYARPTSSAYESLKELDEKLRKARKPRLQIIDAPDVLEDEDLMDMLNAGLVKAIIVDSWKARVWAPVLKRTKVHPEIVLRSGASVGWALREKTPKLKAVVDEFLRDTVRSKTAERRLANYERRFRTLGNPTLGADWDKYQRSLSIFRKYAARYHFDPLMLAAQAYQESRLDPNAKSGVGAIGLMQVMPATGASMKVGDIHDPDTNVHAGTKYMRQILDKHFRDAPFSDQDRNLFAFASYNAGPTRIARMRNMAEKQGLDPNRWFNNVEIVAAENIGNEPVRYVRNIYKYYTAYRLQTDLMAIRGSADKEMRRDLAPEPPPKPQAKAKAKAKPAPKKSE